MNTCITDMKTSAEILGAAYTTAKITGATILIVTIAHTVTTYVSIVFGTSVTTKFNPASGFK